MTMNDSFDGRLSAWLRDTSHQRVPDHLDEVLVRTVATRQRPWWSSPERWLPMDLTSRANTSALPPAARLLLVGLLIVALAAVAIVAVGSQRAKQVLPSAPPFGPARNGAIVYAANGDILSFDPASKETTVLIGGPENDHGPLLSPDGTKLIFGRALPGSVSDAPDQLMVAAADGTGARPVGAPVLRGPVVWSPDSTHIAVNPTMDGVTGLRIMDLDGNARLVLAPRVATPLEIVADCQWLPTGSDILFRGGDETNLSDFGIYTIRADGTGLHAILQDPLLRTHSLRANLSPDGTRVAYSVVSENVIRVADIATGEDQPLAFTGEQGRDSWPVWSPDGSRLAFQRTIGATTRIVVGSATGGDVVETGPHFGEFGAPEYAFSPDGTKLELTLSDGSTEGGSAWLLDAIGGPAQQYASGAWGLGSWQRLAP